MLPLINIMDVLKYGAAYKYNGCIKICCRFVLMCLSFLTISPGIDILSRAPGILMASAVE